MFDDVDGKGADQPHGQHLGLEGSGEFGPGAPLRAVGGAELAGAIDGGGAEQIADGLDHLRVGLTAGGKLVHHMAEQPHRLVGPRQHKLGFRNAPGLLFRDIARQPVDLRRVDLAITQREGGVPRLGDHPVGTLVIVKLMRKGDKRVGGLRSARPVGGDADTAIVNIEDRPVDDPSLGLQPS